MSWATRGLGIACCLLLAACSPKVPTTPTNASTTVFKGGLIPGTNIALTPTLTVPLEKILYWGGVAAIAYYVADPYAPNWEIQEAKFPDDHYKLFMKMKRYYAGGAGEARVVFNRRAKELADANGYSSYRILEYSEGLESNVIGSQRTSEGVIVLTGKALPPPPKAEAPKLEAPKVEPAAIAAPVPSFTPSPVPPPSLAQAEISAKSEAKAKPKAKPKKRKVDCL